MNSQRILGVVLLVAGAILLIVGMNASNSVADRWSNFFTGQFTDGTMWYIVGGIISMVGGAALTLFGGRHATTRA